MRNGFAYVLVGVVLGIAVVVACGNGGPAPVTDASAAADATCDCPPAPPPFETRLIERVMESAQIADDASDPTGEAYVACNGDEVAIGGSCRIHPDYPNSAIYLSHAGIEANGYFCRWRNTEYDNGVNGTTPPFPAVGQATVLCYQPVVP